MIVYIVSTGFCVEDYCIEGIFIHRENAERLAEVVGGEIEERETAD